MDSPLPPSSLPPRRRVEGSSTEHKQQLEQELTSALDLTPFQVANHGKASATEISRQNRKMQPHMQSQVDEVVFGRDFDGSTLPEARQPIHSDILAPTGRLPLRQSRTPRRAKQERQLPGHHLLRGSSTSALLTPRGQRVGLLTPRSQAHTPREANRLSPGWGSTMLPTPTGWDSNQWDGNLLPSHSPERRASLSPTKLEKLEFERRSSSKPNVDVLHSTSEVFHTTPFQS